MQKMTNKKEIKWFYVNEQREVIGPKSIDQLVTLLDKGEIREGIYIFDDNDEILFLSEFIEPREPTPRKLKKQHPSKHLLKDLLITDRKRSISIIEKFKHDFSDHSLSINGDAAKFLLEIRDHGTETAINELSSGYYTNAIYTIQTTIKLLLLLQFLFKKKYFKTLLLKSEQLIYEDDYGDICFQLLENETFNFCSRKIIDLHINTDLLIGSKYKFYVTGIESRLFFGKTDPQNIRSTTENYSRIILILLDSARLFNKSTTSSLNLVKTYSSPVDYEKYVADTLKQELQWSAKTTKGSGDQGADVIAEKKGKILIIQCKLYGGTVGNKAIQEAHAAKTYYNAHYAAVVTNSSFSLSAKQLAHKTGVFTLHHSQLKEMDFKIFGLQPDLPNEMKLSENRDLFKDHRISLKKAYDTQENQSYNLKAGKSSILPFTQVMRVIKEIFGVLIEITKFLAQATMQIFTIFFALLAIMLRMK